ncbi:peptidyl-prolyl cis-trans isomerase [Aquimarina brevivitae]|uniref:Peptidyl-prolyl cis-trans isomerase n=1 Tax=Aquimarina brevivitae TaxID=323412 RepID=A0A4Q7P0J1_9FLAO|nr:peptidyl-prolyl cis-trans isomerase [Aquimarina brevivitae]RZS93195.1 hypothetical protein EV197_1766 [Aquimarina brevivitae]
MRYLIIIISVTLVLSCDKFTKELELEAVARVNDSYLYKKDLKNVVPADVKKEDSIVLVKNFINQWATEQLFIDQAKRNLTEKEQNDFDALVNDYRNTLYINAYKDAVMTQSLNLEVSEAEMKTFYEENIENFNLKEELVQLRYLHLPPDYGNIVATQSQLNRYNDTDKETLQSNTVDFISYSFNDSLWISLDQVISKIPILKNKERKDLLKEGKFNQLRDSTGVYMVKIERVLQMNEPAPLEYIKPTISQIILNQRKRELIKKLEKDITKDAIKNKQFEVYE